MMEKESVEVSANGDGHGKEGSSVPPEKLVPLGDKGPGPGPLSVDIPNHHDIKRQDSLPLSPQPMSPDPVHDLPVELLQMGWRRFWSKREQRPYFFNKNTNESLWEMPHFPGMPSVSKIKSY